MPVPPFTGSAPSPLSKITIADVPITLQSLRDQIMENNAMTKAAARTEVERVINALNDEGRFDNGAHQEALDQIQNFFPLSGGRRKNRSRRSKKRSNRKRNATRRR